ncbi:unnamed protein product, partial [Cyprideis torosa]
VSNDSPPSPPAVGSLPQEPEIASNVYVRTTPQSGVRSTFTHPPRPYAQRTIVTSTPKKLFPCRSMDPSLSVPPFPSTPQRTMSKLPLRQVVANVTPEHVELNLGVSFCVSDESTIMSTPDANDETFVPSETDEDPESTLQSVDDNENLDQSSVTSGHFLPRYILVDRNRLICTLKSCMCPVRQCVAPTDSVEEQKDFAGASTVFKCVCTSLVSTLRTADGQCDSPGSCAKYSQISFMDIENDKILHFELMQSNWSTSSVVMERDGMRKGLEHLLKAQKIQVTDLVTDRSPSVSKMVREMYPNIRLHWDTWHVTKSLLKKLVKASRKAGHGKLGTWTRCVSNHFWHSLQYSGGDPKVAVKRWVLVLKHIVKDHSDCPHGPLEVNGIDDRDYLDPKSPVYSSFKEIVEDKRLLSNMERSCCYLFTSALEAFHSLKLKYAAKLVHYQYIAMEARIMLAVMDHNENVNRKKKDTPVGSMRFRWFETCYFLFFLLFWMRERCSRWRFQVDLASKETRERREALNVPQCVAKTPKPPIEQMMSDYRKRKELQQEVSEKRRRND